MPITKTELRNVFAERLRVAKDATGVSNREFAKQIGVTHIMVSYYLHGKGTPTVHRLMDIAEKLSVSVDYLLGRSEQ